jgi:TolB-like protein/class 3 adenylate cyclase
MAKDHLSGKLAVILHADVAGSTALVQQDEQLAHERIQDAFRRFSETIEKYQGRILELRGDALLAEFERTSDAVTATLAFQADHTYLISRYKDDLRPTVRVGIAMGEVVIADNTVTGSGVVLAQRVEQLADPGGVCITAALHEALPKRMPFDLENLGEQVLKGFDDPVRVYRVELSAGQSVPAPQQRHQGEASPKKTNLIVATIAIALLLVGGTYYWLNAQVVQEEPASIERMAYLLPDKPSIAVLPFTNMSNDADQEYFADGMTEDLITDISKVSGLFVIARNSVFTYKGKTVKVRQVAEELGVRYVMEGSVRRVGNQVRINAQLIDATTGGHVWADRYDGSLEDVFSMQDKITKSIVSALSITLVGQEDSNLARAKDINPDAYNAYLQGWEHYQRHNADDAAKAVPYFEAAIQLDSQYAQAHAALAAVYWEVWDNHWVGALEISSSEAMKNAKEHLHQAMKQPGSLAHWVASNILIAEGNYQAAVTEAKQVVALDSNNAMGYATLAKALTLSGKANESARLIDKAARLDPYSSPIHTAAQKGDIDAVRRLIADRVNVDAKDYHGKTPLHVAAESGHEKVAALLIEAGADMEVRTRPSGRAFADFGSTALILTARWGHTSVAELLINAGADVNARTGQDPSGRRGEYGGLHYAASYGHEGIVELLITGGADIELRNGSLETPLFDAARAGYKSIVELLISNGANVNAKDNRADTSLHRAVISGDYDAVRLLLANGADINATNLRGETPLHDTAYSGHTQITELLLADGADVNASDQNGYTPLRRAVDKGQLTMAELLIKKGADVATRDKYGLTPLHIVAQTDRISIAELLISSGADINAKGINSGFTPLDYAQDGYEEMIEMLERHGGKCTSC